MPSLPSSLALSGWPVDGSAMVAAPGRTDLAAIQTAVNALIAAESGGTAGQFLTATSSTAVAWAGAYTTFTPTWTAGTAPAIGNAVVTARYLQVGKMVHCYGTITFGTTSTFGTGSYTFALPVTAASSSQRSLGVVELFDFSTNNYMHATAALTSTTLYQALYPTTYGGVIAQVGQLSPWTWAVSDFISWNFTYEAA